MSERLIVIGGTAAGLSAASKAKRCKPELAVTVFEKSGYVSYGACGLPYFVGDMIKAPADLVSLTVEQLRDKRDIPTYIHHEVTQICREEQWVEVKNLADGSLARHSYDWLVIATGGVAITPPIPGAHAIGVVSLRTVEDGIAIKKQVSEGLSRAVIVGGGFIGLEMAEQLTEAGVTVELVEALPRLLPFLEPAYSAQVLETLQKGGITVHTAVTVEKILEADGHTTGVCLSDGRTLAAQLVLLSVGAAPNSTLAARCGLTLGLKKAIVVDDHQRTSDPHILACGDCVEMRHLLTGQPCYIPLGTTANKQGRVAGSIIGGEEDCFPGVLGSQVTQLFGLCVAATGLTLEQAKAAGFDAVSSSITKGDRASYYPGGGENQLTLVFERRGGRLLGAQGIGTATLAGRMNLLVAAITTGMTVKQLNELDLLYTPSVAPVYDPILIAASQALKKVQE